jgi:hypothetical protein
MVVVHVCRPSGAQNRFESASHQTQSTEQQNTADRLHNSSMWGVTICQIGNSRPEYQADRTESSNHH